MCNLVKIKDLMFKICKIKIIIVQDKRFLLENNSSWKDPFFFIQAADTQLGLMYNWGTNGKVGRGV